MPNLLQHETSPYLLQHANNPVDWYPWGEEAFEKAKEEQKPIMLSIGYAACHWCHVMEHESFEDAATAKVMNQYFVNIKVDREERPDVDHTYMDALQALTGTGGWPLNIFLTPELKPFYGGTYFPPQKAYHRQSWQEVLLAVNNAWKNRKHEIDAQADELISHLAKANSFGATVQEDKSASVESLYAINHLLLHNADIINGGFGAAPKFPQFHGINYLLRHYHFCNDEKSLQHALLSIDKMLDGGIYDQVGGGLARYSTDDIWLVPHFEKMLYDNALFLMTLSDAYQITQKEKYKSAIIEIIHFLKRELKGNENLYYAAIDADSEGIEGKFYCWTVDELKGILNQEELDFVKKYYDVTEQGNFTEPHHNITNNILHCNQALSFAANEFNITYEHASTLLNSVKKKILIERGKRVRPLTDDKCLLGWNALLNKAFSKTYMATGDKHFLELAKDNMDDMIKNYVKLEENGDIKTIHHTYKNNVSTIPVFLDDIAYLADALLSLWNSTLNVDYKDLLEKLIKYADNYFLDTDTPFYFFTGNHQSDVLVRKKEIYDGATPSGNSIIANVLFDVGILFKNQDFSNRSEKMLFAIENAVLKHPSSFANWAILYQKILLGVSEVSVHPNSVNEDLLQHFLPNSLFNTDEYIKINEYILCKQNICYPILTTVSELRETIQKIENSIVMNKIL